MISLIETNNYRSLKFIHRQLENFQILVGPNASGKTTFLDVVQFISDIISEGIDKAITKRSSNFNELTFSGLGGSIELAIEAILPDHIVEKIGTNQYNTIRYEVRIGLNNETAEHEINEENVLLLNRKRITAMVNQKTSSFPLEHLKEQSTIIDNRSKERILKSASGGRKINKLFTNDLFPYIIKRDSESLRIFEETVNNTDTSLNQKAKCKSGIKKSALGNFPFDDNFFPASTWFKEYIVEGIQMIILDSINIRKSSPPGQPKKFKTDGSNLPWVINDLVKHPRQFESWIKHLRTALPDIETIETVEREDDRHRYLRIKYNNGISVPSWLVSDGTLRLLALTLPAYLPDFSGVYLIEEPENGIHPKAIETVYQSLSSVYNAQILLATHSTVILSLVKPEQILCFAK
ncbi:MAG: ATP-binding protein, partial [Taibaiella sp.]|nr:ATP-binding protein [Taibaiella sp.]